MDELLNEVIKDLPDECPKEEALAGIQAFIDMYCDNGCKECIECDMNKIVKFIEMLIERREY